MVAQRVRVMGMIRAVFVLVTIMPSARKNHRRSGLARLCTLYVCVIVGGLLIGTGVRRWSRQTAIPFESTATTGPAWGHVILEITLSGKTFDEAVRALAVASGARIDVLWGTLPPYLSESARVPEGTSLRNAGLGQALSLLITLCEHDEDHWSRKIVCRAVEGRVYVAAADAGPAVAPVARVFDVRDLLASMSAYRAKHPGFQPNASEWAGMSADNIMSSMPGGSPQVTTSVEDLSDFLRFTSPRSPSLHMSDDMLFVDGRFVAVQPPAVLNDVVLALARLRAADSEGPSMAHAPTGVADASAQLEQILVTVDLGPALLPDAVERLRQITGANLHVNWNRLGIEDLKTHRYELHVKNITLRGALRRLLDGLPLGIRADHGVISVMDSERLDWSSVELEVYDVGDLLDGHHKLPSTEATRFTTWRRESDPRARAAQDLIDAIVAAAPDENWSKNWSVSDIRMTIVGNLLLVRQTPAGQSRIKTVLARLREGAMNARLRHGAVLLFVLIASFITGYVRTPPVHHRPPVQDPNPLGEVLAAVDIEDGTYAATLSYLSRISHANIVANWTALHQLEVEPATMLHINLHLRNVPLREVLNIICSHYEEPHPTIDVYRWTGYLVESGIIIFTMRSPGSDESNEVVTRSYDVSHLMDRLEGLQIVELPDADTGSRRWAQRNAAERLVFLICAMIDPDSWYSAGGIQRFYRKLLVTQTPENQEKVRRFLQTLDTASQPPAKN